uniref:(northern house mosquito) hypothetical protein n=1 Tax=Culex pipiens TaxID=7175 RepID=A0A8D7ZV43_CULPI
MAPCWCAVCVPEVLRQRPSVRVNCRRRCRRSWRRTANECHFWWDRRRSEDRVGQRFRGFTRGSARMDTFHGLRPSRGSTLPITTPVSSAIDWQTLSRITARRIIISTSSTFDII